MLFIMVCWFTVLIYCVTTCYIIDKTVESTKYAKYFYNSLPAHARMVISVCTTKMCCILLNKTKNDYVMHMITVIHRTQFTWLLPPSSIYATKIAGYNGDELPNDDSKLIMPYQEVSGDLLADPASM